MILIKGTLNRRKSEK